MMHEESLTWRCDSLKNYSRELIKHRFIITYSSTKSTIFYPQDARKNFAEFWCDFWAFFQDTRLIRRSPSWWWCLSNNSDTFIWRKVLGVPFWSSTWGWGLVKHHFTTTEKEKKSFKYFFVQRNLLSLEAWTILQHENLEKGIISNYFCFFTFVSVFLESYPFKYWINVHARIISQKSSNYQNNSVRQGVTIFEKWYVHVRLFNTWKVNSRERRKQT